MNSENPKKNIFFRVDSGHEIGTGHFVRCLALGEALRERGSEVAFICRDLQGSTHSRALVKGFPVHILSAPLSTVPAQPKPGLLHGNFLGVSQADDAVATAAFVSDGAIVVVDHYGTDEDWESALLAQRRNLRMVVIDDLADRMHTCDILIDQNYYEQMTTRYSSKVTRRTKLLLGPQFAMVRPMFGELHAHKTIAAKPHSPLDILISFGGTDSKGLGLKVVNAILESPLRNQIHCHLMGNYPGSDQQTEIKRLANSSASAFTFVGYTETPWDHMLKADLYLGAGGSTTWERCALGLPAIVYAISKNQVQMSEEFARAGYQFYLGLIEDGNGAFNAETLTETLMKLIQHPETLLQMAKTSYDLVDGCGLNRVCEAILN